MKRFVSVNVPAFDDKAVNEDRELQGWYEELEGAMSGRASEREITWPVVLILATTK